MISFFSELAVLWQVGFKDGVLATCWFSSLNGSILGRVTLEETLRRNDDSDEALFIVRMGDLNIFREGKIWDLG
jgi:hypothetical protein